MVNDRWKAMAGSSQLEDVQQKSQRMNCGYILCTVLLSVAILLAIAVTGAILFMNHYHAPVTDSPPVISTNPDDPAALVTIDKGDNSHIRIYIDPNCPEQSSGFARLEGLLSSALRALADQESEQRASRGQAGAQLLAIGSDVGKVLGLAAQLKADGEVLRRGHSALAQELGTLQSEQGRLIQLLSESQITTAHLVSSVSDVLDSVNKERGVTRPRLKADLQRAPAKGVRPRGCPNGDRPEDCRDSWESGQFKSGLAQVTPVHYPSVWQRACCLATEGGKWTVIQRREDGSVNFFRGWDAYRDGFGKLTGEQWLGLRRIYLLTIQAHYELRIDLEDFENGTAFAHYGTFGVGLHSVDPEEDGYPLMVADYSGTAGDSLLKHSGMRFTTKDLDNDHSENNCASFYHGAWWYRNCHTSNLNGQYLKGHHTSYADGIEWSSWTGWQYSLKFTEMKIRPVKEEK
ncbi:fibrinogen C domain-containing protein 1 [Lissotriton helveticus]